MVTGGLLTDDQRAGNSRVRHPECDQSEHLAGLEGPPLVLEHTCGHRLIPKVTCQACGEVVDPAETTRRSPTSS